MSLPGISAYYENHLALLEKYWLAEEKDKFIESLPNLSDKKLLNLLIGKLPQNHKEIFDELKLPSNVRSEFLESKLISQISSATTEEQRKKSVEKYLKEYYQYMDFTFPKPVENTSFATESAQNMHAQDNSKLLLPENIQAYLKEKIQKDYHYFQSLTLYGIKQLDEYYLLNLHVQNKKFLLYRGDILKTFSDQFLVKFILSYAQPLALVKNVPFYQQIPVNLFEALSKLQINTFKSVKPQIMNSKTFAKKWFQLNYLDQIELKKSKNQVRFTLKQLNQKRKTLLAIKEELSKVDSILLKEYENHLFYEILVLDLQRQDPDKELFIQFLSSQEGVSSYFNKTFRDEITKKYGRRVLSEYTTIKSSNLLSCNFPVERLLASYLIKMFKKYKNAEQLKLQLSKYLEFNIVNSWYAKVKLQEGQEVPNLNEILSKNQIEELKKSKQISIIAQKTQKFFKSQDDVILTIKTKNMKQIKLKIYEINMEQFYLENPNSNIDQTINLQYLNPTHEEIIQIKDFKNSFQIIEQQLLVGEIPRGCGIFIVELVGQGITSRAVIKKGAIACFEQNHIDGKLIKFYDEQGNLIENMRIWVNGRNEILKNGEYLIPFSKRNESLNILAIRDNFVEKFSIYLAQQQYSFDVGVIYNHESFIVGKKSKVVLHPVLKLGNSKVSVENMQNIKVSANLVNNQNIKSSQKFENVKFWDEKDYVLEIPIKSYTRTIEIVVEGEVKDLQGKVIGLNWRKTISIQLMQGTQNFIDMYLIRTSKGNSNTLKVRGLNGEPMQNLDVTLNLAINGVSITQNIVLKTNKNGQISLNSLNYVSIIKASVNTNYGTISRTWNLTQIVDEISYLDKNLIYHKNDNIRIPFPSLPNLTQENIQNHINFSQIQNSQNQTVYVNKISSIKLVEQESFRFLTFQTLQAGFYNLHFLIVDKILTIRVVQGKKWPNGSIFDQNSHSVYKITQSPLLFTSIGELKEEKGQKQGTNKVTLPINIPQDANIDLESVRIHVFLKNNSDSFDNNIEGSFSLSNSTLHPEWLIQQLSSQQSTFYNNKPLSDEQAYVINRQNEKQFIGNNLEKPRVFLKRIEIRDTTEKEEVLAKEGAYNQAFDQYGGGGGDFACKSSLNSAPYRDMAYYNSSSYVLMNYDHNSHNNFFALSGHSLLNIKFNKTLSITIPQGYSEAIVYLITQDSAIKKKFFLDSQNLQKKKDIKHLGLQEKNETSGWSMSRQIYQLQNKQKRQVSRDSLFCTVSLSNILQFAQIKGLTIPQWVSQWSSYSEVKKLQVYDKQICHELNIYIKRQDPQFFKRVVEPFIRNKISKTFVDLCLLGDKEALSFAVPHRIQTLNEFQKVLLIESLVENGNNETAGDIAISMELNQKSVKRSFQTFKELFDIVLNSQASLPKPSAQQYYPPPSPAGMLFGMAPRTYTSSRMQAQCFAPQMALYNQCQAMEMEDEQCESNERMMMQQKSLERQSVRMLKKRNVLRQPSTRTLKQGFKEVEKTKQYTQTTYAGIKNPKQSINLIQKSPFWAHLATYLSQNNSTKDFLSEGFLYFTKPIEFILACCFLKNVSHADYELSNEGDNYVIQANNSFMLFVKEVKELNYNDKFGVLINQRFFNPDQRYTYEDDGTQIQKLVDEFIVKKSYTLQTVVTNTSGTNLELQLLMDIPSGAIPLMSHQNVQIINVNINSFSTTSYERYFYFPSEGKSVLYPANASRSNVVIAKAKRLPQFEVKSKSTVNKLQSLNDVMRSGSNKEILEYIEKRNIFDSNIFLPYSMLWMLKDKEFFESAIKILKKRNYFNSQVWRFAIFHKDTKCIIEYIESARSNGLKAVDLPIFEYFPYFSRRAHKFMDESKSTIRNVQFKDTYNSFVVKSLFSGQSSSIEKTTLAYYLLLQDRIQECSTVFKSLSEQERKSHQIQTDYLACYLSMYQDYPNFTTAQTISEKYQNYPVSTWNKMFKEIFDTLKQYREDIELQEESVSQTVSEFKTTYIQEAQQLKINVPANTRVQVYFYDINLELYFSDFPFDEIQSLSVIKPKVSKVFASGESREEKLKYSEVQNLGNMIVQVYEFKEGVSAVKIGSFFWASPKLKVKISQNEGSLQVFYDGKRQPGCYVKVYSTGAKGVKFYRDGYTDITGKFKYVLADLQGLNKFSILTITSQGGIINQVSPPSTIGHY